MSGPALGFAGLGRMGGPMAANLGAAGHALVVYDIAGARAQVPDGARMAQSAADLARRAETVFLSLPDASAVATVTAEIAATAERVAGVVVDLSTIGIAAAEAAAEALAAAGIAYIDAPVSGGVAGARAGTISVMAACSDAEFAAIRPLLAGFAENPFHVGTRPGQGQAMKLLNNFLSATAMVATSEAIHFGRSHGLDLATMLDVLNVSTGRNTATSTKFPARILRGSYDVGFTASLIAKDVRLYRESVAAAGTPAALGAALDAVIQDFAAAMPAADFTRLYPYIAGEQDDG